MKKQSKIKKKICFLGAGNMAQALIQGFVKSGLVSRGNLIASDVMPQKLEAIKKQLNIRTTSSNRTAVAKSDIIFLAVKPQNMDMLLREIGDILKPRQLVISIAAGVTTKKIETFFTQRVPVIRTMPNTPALVGLGAIGLSKGRWATTGHMSLAQRLFSTVGCVVTLSENKLNAVTALSGSGPAYIFYIAEALEKAGMQIGLPKAVAEKLAHQTIAGAGTMLLRSDKKAQELRAMVTSPGGTTEAAIRHLEHRKFASLLGEAVKKARDRAFELEK